MLEATLLPFLSLFVLCGCSIEFDTALQWRLHLRKFAAAKEQLQESHIRELVAILAEWRKVGVKLHSAARLVLAFKQHLGLCPAATNAGQAVRFL